MPLGNFSAARRTLCIPGTPVERSIFVMARLKCFIGWIEWNSVGRICRPAIESGRSLFLDISYRALEKTSFFLGVLKCPGSEYVQMFFRNANVTDAGLYYFRALWRESLNRIQVAPRHKYKLHYTCLTRSTYIYLMHTTCWRVKIRVEGICTAKI